MIAAAIDSVIATVYRVPTGSTPLDHTSLLKTVEQRWNLQPLTARDAAAPGVGDVLTLTTPRTDDVLAGVTVPVSGSAGPSAGQVSHLEAIRDELFARYAPGPRTAAATDAATAQVVQDPDQRPPQGDAPRALAGTAPIIQDPDQLP